MSDVEDGPTKEKIDGALGTFRLKEHLTLKNVLLFVPVFHVITASIFLAFYSFSFGNEIATFFQPDDIFQVSFRDLAPSYAAFTIATSYGLYSGLRKHDKNKTKVLDNIQKGQNPFFHTFRSFRNIGILGTIIFSFALLLEYFVNGLIHGGVLMGLLISAVVWNHSRIKMKSKKVGLSFEIMLLSLPLAFSAFSGANAGAGDKKLTYEKAKDSLPFCDEMAVARDIGQYYLAIDETGSFHLIRDDCEVFLRLPQRPLRQHQLLRP